MAIINFWVQEPYKSFLLQWIKKVEWRLNKWKFKNSKIWDFLIFDSWERFEIIWKRIYLTFKDMIIFEWIRNVIPDKKSLEDATNVYYNFYNKQQEKEYWIVAIEVKLKIK